MKKRGHPRSSANLPAHINPDNLPDHLWFNKFGAGKWMQEYSDGEKKRSCRI